jgi:hypothetical protein
MAEGRCFDPDREGANPDCSVGDDEIEIAAVQAAFAREVTAEIEGVVTGLEANKIVFAKRWYKTLVVGQRSQNFRWRKWDVKKKAYTSPMPALA